ncbi:MAG: outer membrane lipoprotein-sorting protein [Myxococcales bacterium]|nr:outer membrane lipoprotein-sorting protein [Myxococcales bacterium]
MKQPLERPNPLPREGEGTGDAPRFKPSRARGGRGRLHRAVAALLTGLFVALAAAPSPAADDKPEDPEARAIVDRMDRRTRGESNRGHASMTITRPSWTRTLEMDYWARGLDLTFVRITAPAKERGVGSLQIAREMWNYLPKVDRTIRIPPSLMGQAWMGSDFTNDDFIKQSSIVVDYTHRFKDKDATIDGAPAWVIESTAREDAAVVWGKLLWAVRKKDDNPIYQEFFDEHGELIKKMTFSDLRPAPDGKDSTRVVPMRMEMVSVVEPDHKTVLEYSELLFNEPIDDAVFTLQNLERVRRR